MDAEGLRASSNPSVLLSSLLSKRTKLQDELRSIEKQVYDMETSYLQDPSQYGNVLKGFEGFLSSSKNTALYGVAMKTLHILLFHLIKYASLGCMLFVIQKIRCFFSLKRSRKFQPEDRLFSLSSVTSPAELAAGRDDGRSDFGVGRPKGGGIYANGQGKPKKGRGAARDAKRIRQSSDPDFDYDDDPELTL
ncbi:chromatin modification-related protein MEAF6-like isoform X2 [Tripterygium wilfordii]|uniref:chromatin modification-related protein MEAF6-like isoform X2 n=1 Tax=Tripterygium wilfordii TaxID=458696 RepID=UPI0018F8369E|nr:chromatin modification-related protein MEAF6-like isoform X2 [Tripterygium wilfordii]